MNEKQYQVAYIAIPPSVTVPAVNHDALEQAKAEAWDKLCMNPLKDHFNRKDVFDIAFQSCAEWFMMSLSPTTGDKPTDRNNSNSPKQ